MPPNRPRQHRKMPAHPAVGLRVSDPVVEIGRAFDVGEHQRHAANLDLVARPQHGIGEQVAERLHRRHLVRRQRVAGPAAVLDDEGPVERRGVAHMQPIAIAAGRQRRVAIADHDLRQLFGLDAKIPGAAGFDRADTIVAVDQFGIA